MDGNSQELNHMQETHLKLGGKTQRIYTEAAPAPVGAYSHAVRAGKLLFISGQGARDPQTGRVKGLEANVPDHVARYDIGVQTRAAIENMIAVLESVGGTLKDVVDVTVFLLNMADFPSYNAVYNEFFGEFKPARTTIGVASLPGASAIEIKAVAILSS